MSALSTIVGGLDASNRPAAGRRVPKTAPQPTVRQLAEEDNEVTAREFDEDSEPVSLF